MTVLNAPEAATAKTLWRVQPEAWGWLRGVVDRLVGANPAARGLAEAMRIDTGTRFIDWIDHVALDPADPLAAALTGTGYVVEAAADPTGDAEGGGTVYRHPGGVFPAVVVRRGLPLEVAIKVERLEDFVAVSGCVGTPAGGAGDPYRSAVVAEACGTRLSAAERHGYRGFAPVPATANLRRARDRCEQAFSTRSRDLIDENSGLQKLTAQINRTLAEGLPRGWVCDLFFAAERQFWMSRNRAARVQYERQQRLGLGWANHDHHTYRSSRARFTALVGVWEALGLVCRERFYAGAAAGWGAQVMEQPEAGIVTFNDVDLSPDELRGDFAHDPLPPRDTLGTVGLWCGLHGESLVAAGMHHLECQFDFDALRDQLTADHGIGVMDPFTDLPYLRQAFTRGENWQVSQERILELLASGSINDVQAERFTRDGAIGSHLENLERNEGFKGFNQTGVSEIIARTDPRRSRGVTA